MNTNTTNQAAGQGGSRLAIRRGKQARPQRVVIYGPEGIGKTTLAAGLPAPLFLDTEEGTQHIDVDRIEVVSYEAMRDALRGVYAEAKAGSLGYKTLVIDTGDRLWDMCARQVIDTYNAAAKGDKIASIEGIGYGKGYAQASELFIGLLSMFDACRAVGLHIVVLCHCRVETISPPDSEAYTMYTIKINAPAKQAVAAKEKLREWADDVLFCNYVTAVTEAGKAKGGITRMAYTEHRATWEAKNRHGLEPMVPMTPEALFPIFGELTPTTNAPATEEAQPRPNSPEDLGFAPPTDDSEPKKAPNDYDFDAEFGEPKMTPEEEDALLIDWHVSLGKLQPGQSLADLPAPYRAALDSRRNVALDRARAWKKAQA